MKKQTTVRLDSDLLEKLKKAAKMEHRSLNNFAENLLKHHEPNDETVEAIEEARLGKSAGSLDVSNFDAFMKSLDKIE